MSSAWRLTNSSSSASLFPESNDSIGSSCGEREEDNPAVDDRVFVRSSPVTHYAMRATLILSALIWVSLASAATVQLPFSNEPVSSGSPASSLQQPGSSSPLDWPYRELEWGEINVLHTTDTCVAGFSLWRGALLTLERQARVASWASTAGAKLQRRLGR